MRPLLLFVALETLVLSVFCVLWWSRPNAAEARVAAGDSVELGRAESRAGSASPSGAVVAQVDRRELGAAEAMPAAGLDPALGVCVAGTVRDERGEPIAEASVTFARDGHSAYAASAANGAFVVTGLAPGTWEVLASADGRARIEEERVLDEQSWQNVDLVLRPWTAVRVRFVDRAGSRVDAASLGSDFESLEVVATAEPLGADLLPTEEQRFRGFGLGTWFSARGGGNGEAQKLEAAGFTGELRLHREPPLYATLLYRHVRLAEQRVESGQNELAFAIDLAELADKRGTLRLRVLDASTSTPLVELPIRASSGAWHSSFAQTDAEGQVVFEAVPPGIALIEFMIPEREALRFHVRVPAGGELDLGDLRLALRVPLRGRVLRADGKPAPEAVITWCEADLRTWPAPLDRSLSAGVDADGRFEVPAGQRRYFLFAQARDGSRAHDAADASDPRFGEVVLRLQPSTRVNLRYDARASTGQLLVVETTDAIPVARVRLDGLRWNRGIELPPGRYVTRVFDGSDAIVSSRPFEVAGETVELVLP